MACDGCIEATTPLLRNQAMSAGSMIWACSTRQTMSAAPGPLVRKASTIQSSTMRLARSPMAWKAIWARTSSARFISASVASCCAITSPAVSGRSL